MVVFEVNWAVIHQWPDRSSVPRRQIQRKGVARGLDVRRGRGTGDQNTTEVYIKLPMLGDVRVRRWVPYFFNLRFGGKWKSAGRVSSTWGLRLDGEPEYVEWGKDRKDKTKTGTLTALMKNNRRTGQSERYHFLPPAWDIPGLIVDFQGIEHVPVADFRALPCLATISSPFAEALSSRFGRYVGRLGTPDIMLSACLPSM